MASSPSTPPVRNQLLAALPPETLARILPKLRPFTLTVRDTLIVPEKPIEAVWFVESGWVSLVTTLDDGTQAEVGLVGREGMVGMSLILGVDTAFPEAFVQANGMALQMEVGAFRRTLEDEPPSSLPRITQQNLCPFFCPSRRHRSKQRRRPRRHGLRHNSTRRW